MKSREELHEYWRNPSEENTPDKYSAQSGVNRRKRSRWLANTVEKYLDKSANILEIGCNVGRNLWYLQKSGYKNLYGFDINKNAIQASSQYFPILEATLWQQPVEYDWGKEYDLIYTMAVLVHIHPDSEFVFERMAQTAKHYIITVEDEHTDKDRHCARNYHHIFRNLGFYQVMEEKNVPGLNQAYIARVLRKDD